MKGTRLSRLRKYKDFIKKRIELMNDDSYLREQVFLETPECPKCHNPMVIRSTDETGEYYFCAVCGHMERVP